MVSMDKEQFLIMKSKGGVFTISMSFQGDELTPISIFYKLQGTNKFLLESAFLKESKGRYSYIGMNPYMKIYSHGKEVTLENNNGELTKENGDVLEVLKRFTDINYIQTLKEGGFVGGAIGYLGYDAIRNYESIPDKNKDEIEIPESFYNLYKMLICYDHLKHIVKIAYNVFEDDDKSYEDIVAGMMNTMDCIKDLKQIHPMEYTKKQRDLKSNYEREEFENMIEKAKEYIVKGDIFQVVLSQRFVLDTEENPFEIYRRLRSINPSPYLFYIEFDGFYVVGSSPESLVKVYDGVVETNPIAGTRPRGKDSDEDEKLINELINDEKEIAEHLMLLDLGRNDIGKVSEFGTVEVKRYMEVDLYSHVMHIVSTVVGKLRKELNCYDALRSCFPAGTVSGAPKVRAMEIIDSLENVRRGVYAGALGFFSYNGNMDTCIAIRTIVFKDNKAYVQGGAGIVFDSKKDLEYIETINKTRALREVI